MFLVGFKLVIVLFVKLNFCVELNLISFSFGW